MSSLRYPLRCHNSFNQIFESIPYSAALGIVRAITRIYMKNPYDLFLSHCNPEDEFKCEYSFPKIMKKEITRQS